ncbi:hypothetical protein VHEMI07104 [[Torrubiella] hemipterigena]|nr:hypothetical protein VHEMI07104 [[Torrubiella] hemipterigena]
MFVRDGTGSDRYFLGAPRHFVAEEGVVLRVVDAEPVWTRRPVSSSQVAPVLVDTKPVRIPRPPNAYILYRKERHSLVKEAQPNITNNEISTILGQAWNRESREVREKYKAMAHEIKISMLKKYPDYQYKPRKPSEKKRRMRRTACDTLTESTSPDSLGVPTPLSSA